MMQQPMDGEDPLDPKKKIFDALAAPAGGTAVATGGGAPQSPPFVGDAEGGGMERMPKTIPDMTSPPSLSGGTPTWNKGANAGKNSGMILGFDTDKLNDPGSGSAAGSKYTSAAKAFSGGLKEDVGVSRGGLGNMLNYLKANGFDKAQVVGDDKIDFGDGNGPIDVIRSDGQIVFQNTSGNPVWEGQGFKPDVGGGGGAPSGGGGGGMGPIGGGVPLDGLLGGDAQAKIQAALAGLSGPRGNAEALLQALMGGR
jgi:hypothetical protein